MLNVHRERKSSRGKRREKKQKCIKHRGEIDKEAHSKCKRERKRKKKSKKKRGEREREQREDFSTAAAAIAVMTFNIRWVLE